MQQKNHDWSRYEPSHENNARISVRNLEQEKIKEQKTDHRTPSFQNADQFREKTPSSPRAVQLKRLKADEAGKKNDPAQIAVVDAPLHLIPINQGGQ